MRTEHFIEELECALTRDECRKRGKELGRQHQLLREAKLRTAQLKSELTSKEKEIAAEIDRLATVVHIGKEKRPVQCHEQADHRRFEISVVRNDSGEVISTRPMDATERKQSSQGDLFAFQADVQRAAAEGARQAREDHDAEVNEDGEPVDKTAMERWQEEPDDVPAEQLGREPADESAAEPDDAADESASDASAPVVTETGTEAAPTPLPEEVNLAPTPEDEQNWANKRT